MTRILIVEDSLLTRRAIGKILKREGYEVLEATNGREGLKMIETEQPDCVLLDLLMPDCDGREVLQTLRDLQSKIPVVVITADIQHTSRQECLDLGAIAVLNKIPDPETVFAALQAALQATTEAHHELNR